MSGRQSQQNNLVIFGITAAVVTAGLGFLLWQNMMQSSPSSSENKKPPEGSFRSFKFDEEKVTGKTTTTATKKQEGKADSKPSSSSKPISDEKALHAQIEEIDKKGKVLFKNKQFLEAAHTFTEALDLIEGNASASSSLSKQFITLTNNRSAMYEKANLPELALADCDLILEKDNSHTKARLRKLRILESTKAYFPAMVEVCAFQLLFMHQNRDKLRLGLPVGPPPVPQSKLEELMEKVLPGEVEKHVSNLGSNAARPLPSSYTIHQLLKSYTGYNQWMAQAAQDGTVDAISKRQDIPKPVMLLMRGRRHVYDRNYKAAREDIDEAYALVKDDKDMQAKMPDDSYARLLEWAGMIKHWGYLLEEALECYRKCSDLEPANPTLLVKQAGVLMDSGKHQEALNLFDTALNLDPDAVDALLHRANLRMIQQEALEAKRDLERCVKLRPDQLLPRLRLVSVLTAMSDIDGARKVLDEAERTDPTCSDIHSYRGELYFAKGEINEARESFEKAIKLDPANPTPYVNAAMAVLNTPPTSPGQLPDATKAMDLLAQAIEVDPQFHAAYVQLGQLRLGMAKDLNAAREVVALYDQGLEYCRTREESKEICSMRLLTVAQVEAASQLKMQVFSMQ